MKIKALVLIAATFSYTPVAYALSNAESLTVAGFCWTAAKYGNGIRPGNFDDIADAAWDVRRNAGDDSEFKKASEAWASELVGMNNKQLARRLTDTLAVCSLTYGLIKN